MKNMKDVPHTVIEQANTAIPEEAETVDGVAFSSPSSNNEDKTSHDDSGKAEDQLQCIHIQRIPANSKVTEI